MILPDIEIVAARVHGAWMQSKRATGVESRRSEFGEELMVPYSRLSEAAKELDRATVRAVYAAIRDVDVAIGSDAYSEGTALIALERMRQMSEEGWTPEHDDEHKRGEMASAAACYAGQIFEPTKHPPQGWPWAEKWWKPKGGRIRVLVKAGALIAAEIDRLKRAKS